MDIKDIFKLTPSNTSINKIEVFLSNHSINDLDYAKANIHLAGMYEQTNNIDYAIKIVNNYIDITNKDCAILSYNYLISVYKKQEDYQMAINTINRKKSILLVTELSIFYYDMVMICKDYDRNEYIRYLLIFLDDDLTKEQRLDGLMMLIEAYYINKEYERYFFKIEIAKELAKDLDEIEMYDRFVYFEAFYFYVKKDYMKVLDLLKEPKQDSGFINEVYLLILKTYYDLSEYRKMSILEAEYEESFNYASKEVKIEFYDLCIKLYTSLSNSYSKDVYLNKMALLEDKDDVLPENKKKKIILKSKDEVVESKEKKYTLLDQMTFSEQLIKVFECFYSNEITREQLRRSLIELNTFCVFGECFILTKDMVNYHYKHDRLYDKKSLNIDDYFNAHALKKDLIVFNASQTEMINPITNKLFDEGIHLLSFNIDNKIISFISDDRNLIEGKLNYEMLNQYATVVNIVLSNSNNNMKIKTENLMIKNVTDELAYIVIDQDEVILSTKVQKLINSYGNISLSEYLSYIDNKYYYEYHCCVLKLLNGELSNLNFIFKFKNNDLMFKHTMSALDGKIYAFIENVYDEYKNIHRLLNQSQTNDITNLPNRRLIDVEISSYYELEKFSVVLINFKDLKKYSYLYGYKFSEDLLRYIGKMLVEYEDDDLKFYHLNFDKIVVFIKDINDKRIIKKKIEELDFYLCEKIANLNSRVKPVFNYGCYRHKVDSREQSLERILQIASDALINSQLTNDKINFYNNEMFKKRFFEEQLITYISEELDAKAISVQYTQCIDYKNQVVEFYNASLNINKYSVDDTLLMDVIKRRGLTVDLERYLIKRVIHELKLIKDQYDFPVKVSINVSRETFMEQKFLVFLEDQIKFFKVSRELLIFNIVNIDGISDTIIDLLNRGYRISIGDTNILSIIKPTYFILKSKEHLNEFDDWYFKTVSTKLADVGINVVLTNCGTKQMIEHYAGEINLFSGKQYSNRLTYYDILKLMK